MTIIPADPIIITVIVIIEIYKSHVFFPQIRLPIDSTEDLVNQHDIPWAIESGSFLYQILYVSSFRLCFCFF